MRNPDLTTTEMPTGVCPKVAAPDTGAPGTREALVARLAEEMTDAWRQGKRPGVEFFLSRHPDLAGQPSAVMDLLYEEICLRHEHGEPIDLKGIVGRFPAWQQQIEVLVHCVYTLETGISGGFPSPGESVADFHLLAELGRGGQGRVFVATQSSLGDRPVVLKMTPCGGQEHLSLARLQHTHIMPLLSVVDEPERNLRVLCMPYYGGLTWAAILAALKDRPPDKRSGQQILDVLDEARAAAAVALPPSRDPATPFLARASFVQAICWLGACLAEALKYARERGLVHLDLKPSNILLTADRQPMLLDFHLARDPVDAGSAATRLGGTPIYMSPEQKAAIAALRDSGTTAKAIDGRSDIYSLGLVLYESLGGSIADVPEGRPTPLCRCNPRVPPGLSDIIDKCLASDAQRRYRDAADLAADLWGHLNDVPLKGVANRSLAERWGKWRRRKPHLLSLFGLLAAVLLVAAAALAVATVYVDHRLEEARVALADGEKQLKNNQYADAESSLQRGLSQLEKLPGSQALHEKLADRLRLAVRAKIAQELHQIADQFRMMYGADPKSSVRFAALVSQCRAFWDKRALILDKLGKELDPDIEQRVQLDILDLAILGSNLRAQLARVDQKAAAYDEALHILDQAEALFGPSAVLFHERQRHASNLGLVEVASAARQRAQTCPPRTAWEHYALGRSLLQDTDYQAAALAFDRAVAMEPNGLWPNFYQGVCAYRLGRFDDAALAFTVCTTLAPKASGCFFNRALALVGMNKSGPALRDFDRALELDPDFAEAALNRGLLHFREKQLRLAAADLQRALAGGANPVGAHFHLALICLAQEDRAGAVHHLEQSQEFGPNRPEAIELLTKLRSQR